MPKESTENSWVWISTPDSLDKGQVSLFAIFETVCATAFGLWAWQRFGLYPVMLISLVVAFLTQLRSPQSIRLGRILWWRYERCFLRSRKVTTAQFRIWFTVSLVVSFVIILWLASLWLPCHTGWPIFWRSAVLAVLAINIALMVMVAGTAAPAEEIVIVGTGAGAAAVAVAVAVAVDVAGAGATAVLVAVVGTAAGFGALAVASVVSDATSIAILSLGFAPGIFLRALAIRFWATLRYFPKGAHLLAQNWSHLILRTDWRTEPMLVPGLSPTSVLRIGVLSHRFKIGGVSEKAFIIIYVPILFLPTYLFRLTLKSTFWAYWPLLWIATSAESWKDETGALQWDHTRGRRFEDWIAFFISAAAIAFLSIRLFSITNYQAALMAAEARGLPTYWPLYLAGIDWTRLTFWDSFPAIGAIFALIVFIQSRRLHDHSSLAGVTSPSQPQLKLLYTLNRIKNLAAYATMALGIVTLIWTQHDRCLLWPKASGYLTPVIGPPLTNCSFKTS